MYIDNGVWKRYTCHQNSLKDSMTLGQRQAGLLRQWLDANMRKKTNKYTSETIKNHNKDQDQNSLE